MKFFCGVQATGRGHLSRFAVVKDMLEQAGHSVYGYATGQELPPYARGISRFDRGPTFFIKDNRIDLVRSVVYNAGISLSVSTTRIYHITTEEQQLRHTHSQRSIIN